jgi:hypothetical protein
MFVKLSILVLCGSRREATSQRCATDKLDFGTLASAVVLRKDEVAGAPLSGSAGPSCADIKLGLFAPDGTDSPSWYVNRYLSYRKPRKVQLQV